MRHWENGFSVYVCGNRGDASANCLVRVLPQIVLFDLYFFVHLSGFGPYHLVREHAVLAAGLEEYFDTTFLYRSGSRRRNIQLHVFDGVGKWKNKPDVYVALYSSETFTLEEPHLRVSVDFPG